MRRQSSRAFMAVLALTVIPSAPSRAASPPPVINFQGVLRDAAGQPVTGSRDMSFVLYLSPSGSDDVFVDRQQSASSAPVTVTNGLFNVLLGGGVVMDGSVPGDHSTLSAVFRDFPEVWLEVQVGSDPPMTPRIRIAASAYAHNADRLDGLDSTQLLRSDAGGTFSGGTLNVWYGSTLHVLGALDLNGVLRMDADGPEGSSQNLMFYEDGSAEGEFMSWNDAGDNFVFSDDLAITGLLRTGSNTTSGLVHNAIGGGVPDFSLMDSAGDLYVTEDLEADGSLRVGGNLGFREDGPDGNQSILFYEDGSPSGESILWSDTTDSFTLTDDLHVDGAIRTGLATPPVPYNCFSNGGVCTPDSGAILNTGDVYVLHDVEVDGGMYLNGNLHLDDDGPDGDQSIWFYDGSSATGARLFFDDGPDVFKSTHGFSVTGALTAAEMAVSGTITSTTLSVSDASIGGPLIASSATINGDLLATGTTRLGGSTGSPTHTLMVENTATAQAMRLIGPGEFFGHQARLNFGDGDFAYIDEPTDDELRIQANGGVGINGAPTQGAGALQVFGSTVVNGNLSATGTKPFVQNHPLVEDLSVVYVALEGDEAGTYTRGSGRLQGGEARLRLGETFAWVTNPDTGLTAQVTPRGAWADLYVAALSTTEIVVRARDGSPDVEFNYLVQGLRIGYERFPIVQPRTVDARIPSDLYYEMGDPSRPVTGGHTALARFAANARGGSAFVGSETRVDADGGGPRSPAAAALRRAIGEFDEHPHAMRLSLKGDASPAPGSPMLSGSQAVSAPAIGSDGTRLAAGPSGTPPRVAALATLRAAPMDADGNVYARSFHPSARDLASLVPVSERVEPGDVLSIDPRLPGVMTLANEPGDGRVFGIVTGAPGVVLGSPGPEGSTTRDAAVVFSGVTLCKVDADLGAIRAGDLLVTSPTPGHAMRSDDPRPGTILGKALESLEAGTGLITVLVMLR